MDTADIGGGDDVYFNGDPQGSDGDWVLLGTCKEDSSQDFFGGP